MKGIILAGGAGSRLYPMTSVITKQLQPIYNKPMIYYPLSLLMMVGIKDVCLITTPEDQKHFQSLLGDGSDLGMKFDFLIQDKPAGIAQAYQIASEFLDGQDSLMILGDNLFHGNFEVFRRAVSNFIEKGDISKASIFAYPVHDPERYGVVEFDKESRKVLSIEEKPSNPKSHYAIPGLYLFDGKVIDRVKNQKPSSRGELEITDLINTYLHDEVLSVEVIGRGMAWLDTGTPESFIEASSYVATIEQRQGFQVACIEEVALRKGFISVSEYKDLISTTPKSPYRKYLETILEEFEG